METKRTVKAIALFSGGLDSIVSVKLIEEQGIEVLGLTFRTPFFGAGKARAAADSIGLPLWCSTSPTSIWPWCGRRDTATGRT